MKAQGKASKEGYSFDFDEMRKVRPLANSRRIRPLVAFNDPFLQFYAALLVFTLYLFF